MIFVEKKKKYQEPMLFTSVKPKNDEHVQKLSLNLLTSERDVEESKDLVVGQKDNKVGKMV